MGLYEKCLLKQHRIENKNKVVRFEQNYYLVHHAW